MISTMEYIEELEQAGFNEKQIKALAKHQEQLIEKLKQEQNAELEKKQLATKYDIVLVQKEIKELETKLQKEVNKILYVYGAGFIFLLGAIAKGFGWF